MRDNDPDKDRGLYKKFDVKRTDPSAQERHPNCRYFVLDLDHDPLAIPAIEAYAEAARDAGYSELADDLEVITCESINSLPPWGGDATP